MEFEEQQPQSSQSQHPAEAPAESRLGADRTKLSLMHFAFPILIENIMWVAMTTADVLMLSFYSEKAVAAVSLVAQFVFFINLFYLMVASGASILISQNLGARDTVTAGRIAQGSVVLSVILSVLVSAVMCLSADWIISHYKLDGDVHKYAVQYLMIYSAGSMAAAIYIIVDIIIRSYGHTRELMFVNVGTMILNVTGNYIFIFGAFGAPVLRVKGVALSTVLSYSIACVILYFILKRKRDIKLERGGFFKVPKSIYRQILAVGIPTAGENMSYNLSQIVIMRIVAALGTDAMTAFAYAMTVLRFVFIVPISIGHAVQIKVGYFVGAKMADIAQRKVYRYWALGFAISLGLVIIAKIFEAPFLNIFTQNAEIQGLAFGILTVALLHEPGRNFNVIIIPALKGAGDVRFPVYVGMIFMWGVGVTLAYIFGIKFGWGLAGICLGMAFDEWSRGAVIFWRWRKGRWKTKALVGKN
ncbi:MAG: MATE family efflux transporter [Chitinispirillales bacterium]|jgi:putative MATE family efflux protein|nr:MATE family efflux transporter [Chitinispirillales bacterium]